MNKLFEAAIGRRLKDRRDHLQLTLKEVAELCGVSYQLIHKYETGRVQISAFRLWQLAHIMKVQVGYFFRDLDPTLFPPTGAAGRKPAARKVNPV